MKRLIVQIVRVFLIVVFSNLIVDWADRDGQFLEEPLKFFGVAVVMSIIGGFLLQLFILGKRAFWETKIL